VDVEGTLSVKKVNHRDVKKKKIPPERLTRKRTFLNSHKGNPTTKKKRRRLQYRAGARKIRNGHYYLSCVERDRQKQKRAGQGQPLFWLGVEDSTGSQGRLYGSALEVGRKKLRGKKEKHNRGGRGQQQKRGKKGNAERSNIVFETADESGMSGKGVVSWPMRYPKNNREEKKKVEKHAGASRSSSWKRNS